MSNVPFSIYKNLIGVPYCEYDSIYLVVHVPTNEYIEYENLQNVIFFLTKMIQL